MLWGLLLAGYAGAAYWGSRRMSASGQKGGAVLYGLTIAYSAYLHLAALKAWPTLTPTFLYRMVFRPLASWIGPMLRHG